MSFKDATIVLELAGIAEGSECVILEEDPVVRRSTNRLVRSGGHV